ncbi:MAG: Cys-tRNA(Pro) deacylase [Acidimicrobiia bacterium]|nr:Cys-tRNA(Pro) deacylase [Acidimicrobiia bacterium]MDH5289149.1 Cys-tRNA(Pro) deacylase [Acidimicrobiia bacterium]
MTPAIKLLEKAEVAHRVIPYRHDPAADSYGLEAAEALGVSPDQVFKTLVATVDGRRHVVAVVPVSTRLDLKAIATAANGKKAAMADPAAAERMTGYVVGGISPLGQRKRLDTFVDDSAQGLDLMYVSGGRRGLDIELAPADLVATLNATYAPIASR